MRAVYIAYTSVVWPVRGGRVTLAGDSMSEPCDEGVLLAMANPMSNPDALRAPSQAAGTPPSPASSAPAARQMRFAALPTAPRMARALVENTTSTWGMKEESIETAKLIMSELATNAVRQTGRAEGTPTPGPVEHVAVIYVRLELHADVLRLAVWDHDTSAPTLQEPTDDAESGRGLLLVDTLALRWGHYFPPAGGKVVWADVPLVEVERVTKARASDMWWPLPKHQPAQSLCENTSRDGLFVSVATLERKLSDVQQGAHIGRAGWTINRGTRCAH